MHIIDPEGRAVTQGRLEDQIAGHIALPPVKVKVVTEMNGQITHRSEAMPARALKQFALGACKGDRSIYLVIGEPEF